MTESYKMMTANIINIPITKHPFLWRLNWILGKLNSLKSLTPINELNKHD